MTEAEIMNDYNDFDKIRPESIVSWLSKNKTEHSELLMRRLYEFNSICKVGTELICPVCGKRFIKKSYQQKFHSSKCKDRYHNIMNPRGIYSK